MKEPLITKSTSETPYDKIAPTALMVAHRRTFTDIPYSQEIFAELEKLLQSNGEETLPAELMTSNIAPQIEARYKLISRSIKESGITQIFELAAGFSPRGLEMTDNSSIEYVETDLRNVSSQKSAIVDHITGVQRPNLHFEVANALDLDALQKAVSHLDQTKPIAIVNEGLLRYLTLEEKARVARNIHVLLEKYGGVWITPDITFGKTIEAENTASNGQVEIIHQLTGINTDRNRFESVEEAQRFFENLGFKIEIHSFMEAKDDLNSPQRLGQSKDKVDALLKDPVIFVMKLI